MSKLLGNLVAIAKKNEKEQLDADIPVEVTDVSAEGRVQLGFDYKEDRLWLEVNMADLTSAVLKFAAK